MVRTEKQKTIEPIWYWTTSAISLIALIISIVIAYQFQLKPFELGIRLDPTIRIQYKGNFGIYIDGDFSNRSPQNGMITNMAVILYKATSPEDKYLLTLLNFRIMNEDDTYGPSEEELPLYFQPWQRVGKVMNFLYMLRDEQFPISMGTYMCEFLAWTDDKVKPKYIEHFKFEMTADVLELYLARRDANNSSLQELNISGYTALKSKKMTKENYDQLH